MTYYSMTVPVLIHRVLAGHAPREYCPECPYVACRHCGDVGPPNEDHTCPCPFSDADCPDHAIRVYPCH